MSQSRKFDIICIGSALQDVFVDIPDDDAAFVRSNHLMLTLGAKIAVDYPNHAVGGGGTNCAINFAIQSLKTGLFSRIAKDEAGERVLRCLEETNTSAELMQVDQDPKSKTGTSVILNLPGQDRIALVSRGVSHKLDFDNLDWELLKQTRWIYVASFGSAKPAENLKRLGEFAKANDIQIAFNPGASQIKLGVEALGPMVKEADILIMNLTEAAELTKSSPKDRIVTVMERLSALGPKCAVVTNGRNGVFAALNSGERYFVTPPVVEARCTLGAGDAFASTLTASIIIDGWENLGKALERATMNSALVVQQQGAQSGLKPVTELDGLIPQHNIKAQAIAAKVAV